MLEVYASGHKLIRNLLMSKLKKGVVKMKRKIRNTARLVLVMVLIVIIASGCGSVTGQAGNTDTAKVSTAANETAVKTASEKQPGWIVDKPTTVRWLFNQFGQPPPKADNPMAPYIAEKTGVNIQWTGLILSSEDETRKKLNLWAASGDFGPYDAIAMGVDPYTVSIINTMGENGMLVDLTDVLPKYPAMQSFVAPAISRYRDQTNGKIYMYPGHIINTYKDVKDVAYSVVMRKDILKELNLSYPKNTDEFYNILKSVKDANLKDNLGKPIIPFSMGQDWKSWYTFEANFFGRGEEEWLQDSSGKWVIPRYSDIEKLTYEATFLNRLWREKLMDPEFFSNKTDSYIQKCSNGSVFCTMSLRTGDQASVDDILMKTNSDSYFVGLPPFPAPGVTKVQNGFYADPWGYHVMFFPKNTCSPEALDAHMKYGEWVQTDEGAKITMFGIEGTHWQYDENHMIIQTPQWAEQMKSNQSLMLETGLWYYQCAAADWTRTAKFQAESVTLKRPDIKETGDNVSPQNWTHTDVVYAVFPGQTEQSKLPQVRDAWKQQLVKAVMAGSEEECKQIIGQWPTIAKNLGYDQLLDERNNLVSKVKQ
jgi:putative aldouronate transport system substrate-binding protein